MFHLQAWALLGAILFTFSGDWVVGLMLTAGIGMWIAFSIWPRSPAIRKPDRDGDYFDY